MAELAGHKKVFNIPASIFFYTFFRNIVCKNIIKYDYSLLPVRTLRAVLGFSFIAGNIKTNTLYKKLVYSVRLRLVRPIIPAVLTVDDLLFGCCLELLAQQINEAGAVLTVGSILLRATSGQDLVNGSIVA